MRPIVEELGCLRRLDADPRKRNPHQVGNKGSNKQRPQRCARRLPLYRESGSKVRRVHQRRSSSRARRWMKNNTSAGTAKSRSSTIASAVVIGGNSTKCLSLLAGASFHVVIFFEDPRIAVIM